MRSMLKLKATMDEILSVIRASNPLERGGVDSVEAGRIKSRELAASAILGRKYFEIYDST